MKAPIQWLRKYTDINTAMEDFQRRMIMAGFEVEGVEDPGAAVSSVVVGRITALEKHPNADKLQICTLDVGQAAPLQIVTGATNSPHKPVNTTRYMTRGLVSARMSRQSAGSMAEGAETVMTRLAL